MLIIGLSQCQCFVNFSCSDVVFANFLYRVAVFRAPWCPPQGGSMDLNYFYSRPYLTSPFIAVCLELPDFLRKTFSLGLESLFQSLGLKTPTQKSSTSSTFFFLFLSFLSLFFFFVSSAIWNFWVIKTKKELHKNCDQNKRLLVVDTCATLNPVDLEVTETPIILQVTHIIMWIGSNCKTARSFSHTQYNVALLLANLCQIYIFLQYMNAPHHSQI